MDCKNPLYRLQERLNELKTALNNLQIVFGMTEKQIEQLIIRIETIGVKQITKEALKELTEQASELLKYKVECIRESIKREPFPPYKERLHPRKHWQHLHQKYPEVLYSQGHCLPPSYSEIPVIIFLKNSDILLLRSSLQEPQ